VKKVFFFLAVLAIIVASCSDSSNEPENATTPSSSNEVAASSSSEIVLPSSSSIAIPSSSSSEIVPSSSSEVAPSSSSSIARSSSSSVVASSSSSKTSTGIGTDYSDMNNWSVFTAPDKLTKEVDIFLLYPTSVDGNAAEDCPYANINNTKMRNQVNNWYRGLGKVVTEHTNPYLPYYRQANVFGGCSGGMANMTGGAAMEDVIAAFEYYLENINKGERPFILLGFSQGSSPLWELAENRLEQLIYGEANRKNHIVTYATGIPGRREISASKPVKFSESYNDINVITAWNPYWESDTSCAANQLGVRASSGPTTNPITWTTDENYHAMTENPTLNQNSILGARVHNKLGILLVKRKTEPSTPPGCGSTGSMYMGQHGQDIPYFSASIIKNMEDRIKAWKEKYK